MVKSRLSESQPQAVSIDYKNIHKYIYLKDAAQYRFIDRATVIPGKSASGTKLCSGQDWYFSVHFPGDPIMPGVFIMETIMQTATFVMTTLWDSCEKVVFYGAKKIRIFKEVRPGDMLSTNVSLLKMRHGVAEFHGEASVASELVCSMDFTMVAPKKMVPMD